MKPAAARGLAHLLHGCRRERPRSELYCRLMRELAWGRSCWARLAFIQVSIDGCCCMALLMWPSAFLAQVMKCVRACVHAHVCCLVDQPK